MDKPARFYYGVKCIPLVSKNVIEETLTRIGICNRRTKEMTPSCHLNIEKNQMMICHFKELLVLRGYRRDISISDYDRRNSIASLLEKWGMIKITDRRFFTDDIKNIYVMKRVDKADYKINFKWHR